MELLRSHEQETVTTAGREWGTGDSHALLARVAEAAYQATYNQFATRLREAAEGSAEGSSARTDVLDELSLRVRRYLDEVVDAYGRYLIAVAPTPHAYARRFPAVGLDDHGRSRAVAGRTGTAFVCGHGEDLGTGEVRVPRGRSVSFYADLDTSMASTVARAVLTAGDIRPRETYHAGQDIPNYVLTTLEDVDTADDLASVSDRLPGKVYLVGADWPLGDSPLRLCTTRSACADPDPAVGYEPDLSTRHHPGCDGLFNRLAEADLHLLICRQAPEGPPVDTTEMDVRPVLDDQGRPVGHATPYGDEPDAYITSLKEQVEAIYGWAAVDLAAAVTYVHSLPQATLAALRSYDDFAQWLECTQHTPDRRQAQAAAEVLVLGYEQSPTTALLWWRALPRVTREILWTRPDVRRCLRPHGERVGEPHRPRGPAPAEFSTAWTDVHWRNAFSTWLVAAVRTPPQQPLLTLYAQLHPVSAGTVGGITMTTGSAFGALSTLADTDVLPAAEHIVAYCDGHFPVLREPRVLDALATDLRDSGLVAPIRKDLERLDISLTRQLDTHYQAFRQVAVSRSAEPAGSAT